jgi:hypothetical protein
MPAGGPEWISVTVVDAVEYGEGQPHPVRLQVGLVRMPDSGDLQVASQVTGQHLFVLPPHSTARIIGALREGLTAREG